MSAVFYFHRLVFAPIMQNKFRINTPPRWRGLALWERSWARSAPQPAVPAGRVVSPPWLFPQCLGAHGLPPEPRCRFVFLLAHFPLSWLTDVHQPQPRPLASVPLHATDLPADIRRSIPVIHTINGHSICSICTAEIWIQPLLSPDGSNRPTLTLESSVLVSSLHFSSALDFP